MPKTFTHDQNVGEPRTAGTQTAERPGPWWVPAARPCRLRSAFLAGPRRLDRRQLGDAGLRGAAEHELRVLALALDVHNHDLAGSQLAVEDLLRKSVLDLALDGAAQRPGTQHGVVALRREL